MHVVIDVVSAMTAYAAITLTASITTRTLVPDVSFQLSTGCGSLMMVLCEPKHVRAAFIILTILII